MVFYYMQGRNQTTLIHQQRAADIVMKVYTTVTIKTFTIASHLGVVNGLIRIGYHVFHIRIRYLDALSKSVSVSAQIVKTTIRIRSDTSDSDNIRIRLHCLAIAKNNY